jgi:peptide/nickel transport system permease protein
MTAVEESSKPAAAGKERPWRGGPVRIALDLAGSAATVVVASFVIFAALSAAPGDPVSQLLGPHATSAARAHKRAELGLDEPLLARYWHWLTSALHGNLGTSYTFREDVTSLIGPRIQTTLLLVAMTAILILVFGIALGVLGGVSRRWGPAVSALSGLGISIPAFVSASFLIGIFAVQLGWFPTYGGVQGFADRVWHLVLPSVALSIGYGAYVTQLTSAAVREEQGKEHLLTSRGRGVPPRVILRRHVLRNAALPVMTASGIAVAGLVAGALVVEEAFGIDGIGSLLVKSVSSKDYPVVIAISLIIVVTFVAVTTVIDLAQLLLDPRQREEGR